MKWIDTHAHIYDLCFKGEDNYTLMIERSRSEGLSRIYMPNLNLETLPRMCALADDLPDFCKPMIGLHPCDVANDFEEVLDEMEGWFGKHSFVGIGEVGLDFYHSRSYEKEQIAALKRGVEWARKWELPLVIHCRDAFDILLALLEDWQDGRLRGVIHCFTGTVEEARRFMALGFYLGIGGIVTYQKGLALADLVKSIPLSSLLLETDSPYLAPIPKRGKENEPSYLPFIGQEIARLKGVSVEEVARVTTSNALRLFE